MEQSLLIGRLESLIGSENVSNAPAVLEQHSRGESFDEAVLPAAVAFPASSEQEAQVMRFAAENELPVTPLAES